MLTIDIPGRAPLELRTLLLDYNGTIAVDGILLPELVARIHDLQRVLTVVVLTADTYGTVAAQCDPLGISVKTFPQAGAAHCKGAIAQEYGGGVVSLGNGFNDIEMFDSAALSIAVLGEEGMCAALLPHADILVRSAQDGLDLLLKPDRIRAALRT